MKQTRFHIIPRRCGAYTVPCIQKLEFTTPKRLGAYCANTGHLFTDLDGDDLFKTHIEAQQKLDAVWQELKGES